MFETTAGSTEERLVLTGKRVAMAKAANVHIYNTEAMTASQRLSDIRKLTKDSDEYLGKFRYVAKSR